MPHTTGHRRRCLLLIGTFALAALAALLLLAAPAPAEDPFRVQSQLEDEAGVLDGAGEERARAAIDELRRDEQVQLWMVYVDTFSGVPAQDWADQTAQLSDLGVNDVLLAVAVQDRAYAYSVDGQFPLSEARLAEVVGVAVEPWLVRNDWAGAVVGAAEGLTQALRGEQVGGPDASVRVGRGLGWLLPVLLLFLAGIALLTLLGWRRSRRQTEAGGRTQPPPAREAPPVPLDELRRQANLELVQTDDAVKTSEQELGYAGAEFGEQQAEPFRRALDEAREELAEAFRLRRRLDETDAGDDATQRALLGELLQHTRAANERLDAEAERFDRLRDLEANAPQTLDRVEGLVAGLDARVPQVEAVLTGLLGEYSPGALAGVVRGPEEARGRLTFARERVAAAREDLQAGRRGEAVVETLAAEEAAGQAAQLLDAVERLRTDLSGAAARIEAALDETDRDIAEARALERPALSPLIGSAEAAMSAAREAAAPEGGRDPLRALRRLEEADAALERALQEVRDARVRDERARTSLQHALPAAEAQVATADSYITTHRGAVSSGPRAQLAEAQRLLAAARLAADPDPVTGARTATEAHRLAGSALEHAQADVEEALSMPQAVGMGGFGGPVMGSPLGGLGGAMLGGILVSTMLGGGGPFGSAGGRRGGFGGFGGRRSGGGGFGPASFGGMGTRMRRGGGGRF